MIGTVLDSRYKLEKLLGTGGMGAVYEATHLRTGRRVALKLIRDVGLGDTDVFHRFEREARASSAMNSRHIVEVLDSGRDPSTMLPFMAMDLLRGRDLGALIDARGALPVNLCLRILAQACLGLSKAHQADVVHRDIKPANLFLTEEEDDEIVVKLLDFGIAKVRPQNPFESSDRNLTQTGRLLGTPLYMSPEQAEGARDVDARSDIWSLGCVFYEALTGRSPHHHAETLGKLIVAITTKPVVPPSVLDAQIPSEVDRAVMRALAIDRNERYPSADAMLEELTRLLPDGAFVSRAEVSGGAAGIAISSPKLNRGRPRGENSGARSAPAVLAETRPTDLPVAGSSSAPADVERFDDVGVASTLFASNITVDAPRRRRRLVLLAGAALAAAAVAALSVVAIRGRDSRAPEARPASAPAPSANDSAQAGLAFSVAVEPADVTVVVAGETLPVVGGSVELHGPPGAEIVVTLSKASASRKVIVTLSERGAEPRVLRWAEPAVAESAPADATASASATLVTVPPGRARPSGALRPSAAPAVSAGPRVNRVFD